MDTGGFNHFVYGKYRQEGNPSALMLQHPISQDELAVVDSVLLQCYKTIEPPAYTVTVRDTARLFYLEFLSGRDNRQLHSFRVYGIVDCILFLDRMRERLKAINPKFETIDSFRLEQAILTHDRLCRCADPG